MEFGGVGGGEHPKGGLGACSGKRRSRFERR